MTYEIQALKADWKVIAVEYSLKAAKRHLTSARRFTASKGDLTKHRIVRVTYEVL